MATIFNWPTPTVVRNNAPPEQDTDSATKAYVDAIVPDKLDADISNVRIAGGTSGQYLQTDGAGNLAWATGGGGGNATPAGVNTQVQFNNAGVFGASANLTFDNATNILTVTSIVANGSGLSSINGANVTGQVANALVADTASTVTASAQPAITSVGTLNQLNVSGQSNLGLISNVIIGGGSAGQVLTTDGTGQLSWTTVSGGGGGGGSLVFTARDWLPGLGPANQTSYWDGNSTQVNYKSIDVGYLVAGSVNTIDVLTLDGQAVSTANITVTDTGFTIPAVDIPLVSQVTSDPIRMIIRLSDSGTANIQLGATDLSPVLISPVAFSFSGLLTATGTAGTATPYWQAPNAGAVTVSGLTLISGVVSDVSYSLYQSGNLIANATGSDFNSYTFANVAVGTDYSVEATVSGIGLYGADPNVVTTLTSTTTSVLANTYQPLFYQTTADSTPPVFTDATSYLPQQFVVGSTITLPDTTGGQYYWAATPTLTPRTFTVDILGTPVSVPPDVVANTAISGQDYNIYGFTNSQANTVLTIN